MASLVRLQGPKAGQPKATEPTPVNSAAPDSSDPVGDLGALLSAGRDEVESKSADPVEAPSAAPVAINDASNAPTQTITEISKESASAHVRPALDYLNILQSLAPVFKAATIYPGHDAAPGQIGAAVQLMSQVSVKLADYIAAQGDKLELDPSWSRKVLHAFTAELVSSHWVTAVIAKGGVMKGQLPALSVEYFIPAIQAVLDLPASIATQPEKFVSSQAAVQIALITGITPIAIEVEKYATIINARIPGANVSEDALTQEISQFLVEKSAQHLDRFIAEGTELSDDDRQVIFQTLIKHSASVVLSAWEYCKGEVLGAIKEAESQEEATRLFSSSEFVHGFPLAHLKARASQSLQRLTGASQYAMTLMRKPASQDPTQGS